MNDTAIRSRWVLANGVRTHYAEAGDQGRTLVALHGGGAGSSGASGMGPVLPLLGRDFRVVAPDSIGGFGLTDTQAPTPYGLISRAAHTADFVDALCLDKFSVLGNSQGAWSGVYYAMLHPDRVEKLVIVSSLTIAGSLGLKQAPNEAMHALMGYDGSRAGMKRLLEALIIDKARITDALIDERQRAATRPGAFEAFQRMAQGIDFVRNDPVLKLQTQWQEALPALTRRIPTLILWGEEDTFAVPATGRALAEMLPDARIEWVPGAGHQVQVAGRARTHGRHGARRAGRRLPVPVGHPRPRPGHQPHARRSLRTGLPGAAQRPGGAGRVRGDAPARGEGHALSP
ncbi:MAG: hypothetical protein ABT00_10350 [Bordetella sp. SCN 68-11]|nr:MAG: hypothetical protein ABT00_10350 [Bordetella sp. SCN 68-11]